MLGSFIEMHFFKILKQPIKKNEKKKTILSKV